jgi:hypothetical protein
VELLPGVTTVATWSLAEKEYNLSLVSKNKLSKQLKNSLYPNTLNLIVEASILKGRSSLYTFSLTSSHGSYASVTLRVNRAPSGGVFTIYPLNGSMLSTKFLFTAPQWQDVDTPLRYSFGYFSSLNTSSAINSLRRELQTGLLTSVLPAGEANSNKLKCYVHIHDVFGAKSEKVLDILVWEVGNFDQQLSNINLLFNEFTFSDYDRIISAVVVGSSVINRIDCSNAPNCSLLLREECGKFMNTCGECYADALGDSGSHNYKCISSTEYSTSATDYNNNDQKRSIVSAPNSSTLCLNDSACVLWDICRDGSCTPSLKHCPLNCSDRGKCIFINTATGRELVTCAIGDVSCHSECLCLLVGNVQPQGLPCPPSKTS